MKIIIKESQYKLLVEQKRLSGIQNVAKLISRGLLTLVWAMTRGYNSFTAKKIKDGLERVQSLTKQSLANGRVDLTDEEMNLIRENSKIILNGVANRLGYGNWNDLKNGNLQIRDVRNTIKKYE
jgi:hypothetical protein